jgi:hypothetical protein
MAFWQILILFFLTLISTPVVVGLCIRLWYVEKLRYMQLLVKAGANDDIDFRTFSNKGVH